MKLRKYQQDTIDAINKKIPETNKQVAVLATGLGKTVIFSHLISQRNKATGKKALILAHREELLTQAKDKLLKIDPSLDVGIEMADQKSNEDHDVIVASVATIGRSGSERIKKFDPNDFGTIVIDEAHHASASTYKNVLKHFGVLKPARELDTREMIHDWNKECLLLGVTATPNRMDNEGIDKIFDEVVYNYGILEGVQDAWLSRIRAYRVDTRTSLDEVHTRAGDFAQDELADAINNPERNDLVVKTYLEQFSGKQALVFAIDIAHAEALTAVFKDKDISAVMISGSTEKEQRKNDLQAFHDKKINVIVNCMVLTEGYDNDTIDIIMMARPTKSGILYQQMVGRGTRTHEDKPHLTIVDFVDNTYKHTIKTTASLFGLEGKINFRGTDVVEGLDKIKEIRELVPDFNLDRLDFDKLDYIMEEVDLLSGLEIPTELKETTKFAWQRYGPDSFRIGIGNGIYFIVEQTLTKQWKARSEEWNSTTKQSKTEILGEEETLNFIIERTDQYIKNNFEDAQKLINMKAPWRKDPVSDAQKQALTNLGVAPDVIAQLNKGTASQLQTKLYAKKAQQSAWRQTAKKANWR